MPAPAAPPPPSDWVPAVVHDWTPPPARPKKQPPKPKPKPRKKRALTRSVSAVLIDRVEAAVRAGRIDLLADADPCPALEITAGEYALLLEILFPEEFAPRRRVRAPAPTATAPGSTARVEEYAARVAAGRALFAPGDARADGPGRGLRIVQRANGTGPRVVGWEGDEG